MILEPDDLDLESEDEDDFDDYGCIICGAERSSACRCDYDYEQWAGK